jgi:hypothetical protein
MRVISLWGDFECGRFAHAAPHCKRNANDARR